MKVKQYIDIGNVGHTAHKVMGNVDQMTLFLYNFYNLITMVLHLTPAPAELLKETHLWINMTTTTSKLSDRPQ